MAGGDARARSIAREEAGDTVGGAFEVIAHGVPPGLGSHVQWDRKLDGRLAQALMSIPAIKAVGIGRGAGGRRPARARRSTTRSCRPTTNASGTLPGLARPTNHAGGLEGGVTNGEDVRVTACDEADLDADEAAALGRSGDDDARRRRRSNAATSARCRRRRSSAKRWSRSCWPTRVLEKFGGDTIAEIDAAWRALRRRRHAARSRRLAEPRLMLRPIVRYGARRCAGRAARSRRSTSALHRLIDDMIDTMYAAPGIGLAAPQVGVPLRVCVIDLSVGKRGGELLTLINPEFVERDGMQLEEEGCLSVPGFNATVARPARAVVRALDRHGAARSSKARDCSRARFSTKLDHLDGMLFLDRLRGIKRDLIVAQDPEAAARREVVMPLRVAVLRHAGVRGADARALAGLARTRSSASSPSRTGRAAAASNVVPEAGQGRGDRARPAGPAADAARRTRRSSTRFAASTPTSASSPRTAGSCPPSVLSTAAARHDQRARVAAAALARRRADPPRDSRRRRRRPA